VTIIFLLFFAISFNYASSESNWLWSDYPFVAVLLILLSISLALIWVKVEKIKTQHLSNEINERNKKGSNLFKNKINLLTHRQREIFDLIASGKSNKEIIEELFIELSTLKTHINKIYKTLEISNRKEARAFSKNG
jgi:ATP/maltotriose-dependent transcriptional regulator MalT